MLSPLCMFAFLIKFKIITASCYAEVMVILNFATSCEAVKNGTHLYSDIQSIMETVQEFCKYMPSVANYVSITRNIRSSKQNLKFLFS
jgi:hypothetical protein